MDKQAFIKRSMDLGGTLSRMHENIDLPAFLKHLQNDPGGSAILGALVGGGIGGIGGMINGGEGNRISGGLKGLGLGALTGAGVGALGSVVANKAPHYKLQSPILHNAGGYSLQSPVAEKTLMDYTQNFKQPNAELNPAQLADDSRKTLGLPGGFQAPKHNALA